MSNRCSYKWSDTKTGGQTGGLAAVYNRIDASLSVWFFAAYTKGLEQVL